MKNPLDPLKSFSSAFLALSRCCHCRDVRVKGRLDAPKWSMTFPAASRELAAQPRSTDFEEYASKATEHDKLLLFE